MLLKVPKGGKEPSLPVVVTPCLDFAGFARWGCQVFKRVENPVSTEKRGDKKKMIRRVEQKERERLPFPQRERETGVNWTMDKRKINRRSSSRRRTSATSPAQHQ